MHICMYSISINLSIYLSLNISGVFTTEGENTTYYFLAVATEYCATTAFCSDNRTNSAITSWE